LSKLIQLKSPLTLAHTWSIKVATTASHAPHVHGTK
jgi:hypothetical protein